MKEKSRRQFLKGTIGTLGGTVLAKMAGLFPEARPLLARSTQEAIPVVRPPTQSDLGELYAGFLILSSIEDALSVEDLPFDREKLTYQKYNDLTEVPAHIRSKLYLPTLLPSGISPKPNVVIEINDETHVPKIVSVFYPSQNSGNLYPIDLIAQYDFPKPYPVVPRHNLSLQETEELEPFEKIDFTPQPGIMMTTAIGYVVHWIENDILYTCVSESSQNREEIVELVSSLRQGSL